MNNNNEEMEIDLLRLIHALWRKACNRAGCCDFWIMFPGRHSAVHQASVQSRSFDVC